MLKLDLRNIKDIHYGQVLAEGRAAAWDGLQHADNPYPAGSRYAQIWLDGFDSSQKGEIKSVEKDFRKLKGNSN